MDTPKPPTGALTGKDGSMLLKGSAGHLARGEQGSEDPAEYDRTNKTGLDHFTGGGEDAYDPYC